MGNKPLQDRKLTLEEAFADVPKLHTAIGEEMPAEEAGTCWMKLTLHATLWEYETYIHNMRKTDWRPYTIHEKPLHNITYTALYTKGDRYLCAAFFNMDGTLLPTKLFITVGLLPNGYLYNGAPLFDDVPCLPQEDAKSVQLSDVGDRHWLKTVSNMDMADYEALLAALEQAGFEKFADNGAGIAERVCSTYFTKDDRTLTATYVAPLQRTYLSVGKGAQLSPYLRRDTVCARDFAPDARTSVHMLELWNFGNSFVIKLKNGHFLINDGGLRCETPYLLDYLDSLTPTGEKPVIEGWFISHGHADHVGVLIEIGHNPAWAERIVVEGIYFSEPALEIYSVDPPGLGVANLARRAGGILRTSTGELTPFYRPHMGERYYFADMTVDVLMSQEQLAYKDFSGDLNDTSTWFMLTIEGQKVLLGGDGDSGGRKFIMQVYDSNYMVVDVMSVLHHGWNTRNDFTNYCHAKTVLFTCYGDGPRARKMENNYLRSRAEESFSWGEGTRVLTFPYHVGESKCMPHFDWSKHNAGQTRPVQLLTGEKRE